jgi:hypothetical protein
MKTLSHFLIIISGYIFFSCAVEEKIYFNRDFSGTVNYKLDLSAMNSMMTVFDSTEGPKKSILDSIFAKDAFDLLQKIEGISSLNYNENRETGLIECSFNFSNLTALNTAFCQNTFLNGEAPASTFEYFSNKGNMLVFNTPTFPKTDAEEDNTMGDLFTYKFTFGFEKPVKKFDNKDYSLSEDKKELINVGQLMILKANASRMNVTVKF